MGTSERSIHLIEIYKIYENFFEKILEIVTNKSTEDVFVYQRIHHNILFILERKLYPSNDLCSNKLFLLFCKIHCVVLEKLLQFSDFEVDENKQKLEKLLGKRKIDTIWFEYFCEQSISIEEAHSRLEEVVEKYKIDPELNDFSGSHMRFIKFEYLLIHGTLEEYMFHADQAMPIACSKDSFI